MIENSNSEAKEDLIEDVEVQIIEDPPEGESEGESVKTDDELENYTKSVSKRINKLNQKTREAEERAQYLEQVTAQKDQELEMYRQHSALQAETVLVKEEEALSSKSAQVDDVYKKAVQSGDADLMSKADSLKNDIAIQKEKLRIAKSRQEAQKAQEPSQQENYRQHDARQQSQPVEQEIKPTREAMGWHEKNSWYGDGENEENLQATQFAYFTHFNLINEGFEPDSDEYYEALDSRVFKVYPDLETDQESVESNRKRPAVQRVASASPAGAGRQKTRDKQRGVSFNKSEVERLRGLKPHNMSEEAWLKRVAIEKQKIAQREAS
tara:strand:- start:1491 stop:2462 length:972 start_codon:yes stop_codon:yes gene_type:complete